MTTIKTFFVMLLMMVSVNAAAQTYTFKTTGFSVMERNANGEWGKWSDLKPAEIIVTLDTTKDRIVIYSQEIQVYKIVNYDAKEENETDLVYPFTCADENGWPCVISFITRKSQDNRKQLYIKHQDVVLMYNIVNHRL